MKLSEEARDAEVTMTFGEFQDTIKAAVSSSLKTLLGTMADQIRESEKEGPTFRSGEQFAEFLDRMAKHADDPDIWQGN
jgi:hypothetical protein